MTTKILDHGDPLRPAKLLIDSEIDADRIDSTARDGLLAGREYGTYDIERICTSVRLNKHEGNWRLAYSHKALGSLESLLLDRYRTHAWIHFHHRVVAMKAAAREVISRLLQTASITKASFPISNADVMSTRDDVWLWSLIRQWQVDRSDGIGMAARKALLFRDCSEVTLLWKDRTEYEQVHEKLWRKAGKRQTMPEFTRSYEDHLSDKLGVRVLVFWLKFNPTGTDIVPLTTDDGQSDAGDLRSASKLVESLQGVWNQGPKYHMVLIGKTAHKHSQLLDSWINHTAHWLSEHG